MRKELEHKLEVKQNQLPAVKEQAERRAETQKELTSLCWTEPEKYSYRKVKYTNEENS